MKRVLYAMTAVSALAIAAPAAAQWQREFEVRTDAEFNQRFDARLDMIENRLDDGVDAGSIDRTEARNMRAQLRTLTRLQREYSYNGLTQRERAELVRQLQTLRQEIRMADSERRGRGYSQRYGSYEDDDWFEDEYQGRGGPYDADGDGWDDRDCDRDGDVDSGTCDARREGLGGFIDTILGTGGLRVGQRVTGELYAVPSQYRDRYRDDYRYYYRSDGRRIYQIDARTDVVARVYPMP